MKVTFRSMHGVKVVMSISKIKLLGEGCRCRGMVFHKHILFQVVKNLSLYQSFQTFNYPKKETL